MRAISEIMFEKKDRPDLIASFKDRFNFTDQRFPFAHVVYVNNESQHLLYASHGISMEVIKDKPCFKEDIDIFMNKFQKRDFKDILFFVSTYPRYPSIEVIFNKKFPKDELIDYFTRDSYGYLVWQYQLHHLIMAIHPSNDWKETEKLTWGIQGGDNFAIETAKKLSIGKNNLYDVLKDRGFSNVSFVSGAPKFKDAYIIYEALNG